MTGSAKIDSATAGPVVKGRRELIILLLRSAPVPFAAIRGCAEAHDISQPPVIGAHIASELFNKYGEERQSCPHLWWLLENSRGKILGTITNHPHPFVDRIRAHPAVELVEVTEENRDALPAELAKRLAGQVQTFDWLVAAAE